jgi:hypothetical protein
MYKLALTLPASALLGLLLPAARPDEPLRLKPTNLAVNTRADEDNPHLASDGLTLYYASNAKGKYDLMVSTRSKLNQPWGKGKALEDWVQTEVDDRSVFVTPENLFPQYLYYATKKDKKNNNFDVFVAVKQFKGKAFSSPVGIDAVDTGQDEMHPWLTKDGLTLYFSRKTADGWRVFVTTRKEATGARGFDQAKVIAELPPGFHHATLTPNRDTMYLQGPLPKNRWGLFVSYKTPQGWSNPEPLEGLNHPDAPIGDCSPNLSRDGKLLYYASDRPDGKGGMDLWVIPTIQFSPKN